VAKAVARKGDTRRPAKIVVTGPFGAGKTSLIQTISEIEVLSTEKSVSDRDAGAKAGTTVAMDFGRLSIDDELALYLFGTPGQQRFDFMWGILAEGMLGFVVMIDATQDASFDEAADILRFFSDVASVPFVVALNKTADADAPARARRRLALVDDVRVITCDALDRASVKAVLLELLYAVLDDIAAQEPAAV